MIQKSMKSEQRTPEQIREHYEVEKELANRLRNASKQDRCSLYSSLYDELFQRVPHHPLLTRKSSPIERTRAVSSQMKFLRPFLWKGVIFLEIGPDDCTLSFEVAKLVKQVYAIDVSYEITKALTAPENFQLILSDGCSIPVPPNSVNIAYSNQLMEHLHPEDAFEQLQNIYNALAPGGFYICITPNRLTGPHDVSKYFDVIATGFHLKEYTILELYTLFRKVGFSKIKVYVGGKGIYKRFPFVSLLLLCERLLIELPFTVRNVITHSLLFRGLLNCRLVGIK
jgi:SAM-dependent methyltransferase